MNAAKESFLVSLIRLVVAVGFAVGVAVAWLNGGQFPMGGRGFWLAFAMDVVIIAEITNIYDYKICMDADSPMGFLGGKTLREVRALIDIVPLWVIGAYVFGCIHFMMGWSLGTIAFAVLFVLATVPQALGLSLRCPMLSTFLGRFVPCALSGFLAVIVSACYSWSDTSNVLYLTMVCSVAALTFVFVLRNWRIGR